MWFPIEVQYISYDYLTPIMCHRLPKCVSTVYDLDLENNVKVKLLIWHKGLSEETLWHFEKDAVVKSH